MLVCEDGSEQFMLTCTSCSGSSTTTFVLSVLGITAVLGLLYWAVLRVDDYSEWKVRRIREAQEEDGFVDDFYMEVDIVHKTTLESAPLKSPRFLHKLKIVLGFLQMAVGVGVATDTPWPDAFKDFISLCSFSYFDLISWTRLGCLTEVNFYHRNITALVFPGFVAVALYLVYLLPFRLRVNRLHEGSMDPALIDYNVAQLRYTKLVVFSLFLLFPSLASMILRVFPCTTIASGKYLTADMTLVCGSGTHVTVGVINILAVGVYILGVPLYLAKQLTGHRRTLHDPSFQIEYGVLYGAYRPQYYLWDILDMLVKVLVTGVIVLLPGGSVYPVAMSAVVGYLLLTISAAPHIRKSDDTLQQLVLIELFLMLFAAHVYDTQGDYGAHGEVLMDALFLMMLLIVLQFFVLQMLGCFCRRRTDQPGSGVRGVVPTTVDILRRRNDGVAWTFNSILRGRRSRSSTMPRSMSPTPLEEEEHVPDNSHEIEMLEPVMEDATSKQMAKTQFRPSFVLEGESRPAAEDSDLELSIDSLQS